jgi:hypothetical protein
VLPTSGRLKRDDVIPVSVSRNTSTVGTSMSRNPVLYTLLGPSQRTRTPDVTSIAMDIYNPHHDFTLAKSNDTLIQTNGSWWFSTTICSRGATLHARTLLQYSFQKYAPWCTTWPNMTTRLVKRPQALKILKESGVLSHEEYVSKANQVNEKYLMPILVCTKSCMPLLPSFTRMESWRKQQEFETKRPSILMKLQH